MKKVFMLIFILNNVLLSSSTQLFQYISPKPGSILNSRETNIILRPGSKIDPSNLNLKLIEINGSMSGAHGGNLILSDDDKTIVFNPHIKFLPNEVVTVSLKPGIKTISGDDILPVSFSFTTTPLAEPLRPNFSDDDEYQMQDNIYSQASGVRKTYQPTNGDSLPSDFPKFTITGTGETAPGLLFGGNNSDVDTIGSYSMIIDNFGIPVYYQPYVGGGFSLQPNGLISYNKALGPKHQYIYMILDSNYTLVDSFQMGNGYIADSHDFLLLPNGHAIMLAYDIQPIDMSQIVEGGQPNAQVTGSIIQELDIDKNVVYQWRCWDYIPITDSYRDLKRPRFDYIHVNSVELDNDGNIILSCRETWDAIKISRETGEVIWRLGGKQNEFTFINEHEENAPNYFKLQHSVRRLPNGNLTIFDNGADKNNPERTYSRAVEYAMDEENKTVTMVWDYRHAPDILALTGGTVQRLPNGNTLISWGGAIADGAPAVTEVTPEGSIAFELSYEETNIKGGFTRHPWNNADVVTTVTHTEIKELNTYDFNEGDSLITGISIEIHSFTGDEYNELIVTKVKYGPVYPQFTERAPMVFPTRVVVSKDFISDIDATISFDTDVFGLPDPSSVLIFHRVFEGKGLFVPLETLYNPVTKKLSATMTRFGEFILGYPDFTSVAYAPNLLSPADSSSVNQTLAVSFRWAPVGYFNTFQLQMATDIEFNTVVLNEENLKSDHFQLDSIETNTTYYWRSRSVNDAGESNWSEVYMFTSTAPNIDITAPNGGEQFQRGFRYFIEWNDNIVEDVVIELYRGGESAAIIDTTSSTGNYNWSIDPYLSTGSEYSISVRSVEDTNLFDLSDTYFTIIDTISTSIQNDDGNTVKEFQLFQNFPNPFNPSTKIKFALPRAEHVRIEVYNTLGQMVRMILDKPMTTGFHEIAFDARNLPSGIYFSKIEAGEFQDVKKMILLR